VKDINQFNSGLTLLKLSIVIPVVNEAGLISPQLEELQSLRASDHEIIVVDGGSQDGTASLAEPLADHVLLCKPGRGAQMNAGAEIATGDILVFLHIDTRLPQNALAELQRQCSLPGFLWGRFDVKFTGSSSLLGLIAMMMNLRSHVTGVATGDQAIFIERLEFLRCGGFSPLPLMEDIEMSKRLRRNSWPRRIRSHVIVSSRRWERDGLIKTIVLMWWLRFLYVCGVSTNKLSKIYYK